MGEEKETKKTAVERVRLAVVVFLKDVLNVKEVKVVKITKIDSTWETEAEVYEESSFIKALGLPTRVKDRNIYSVKLNSDLEVDSYEREGQARLTE